MLMTNKFGLLFIVAVQSIFCADPYSIGMVLMDRVYDIVADAVCIIGVINKL